MAGQTTIAMRAQQQSGNGLAMTALSLVAIVALAVAGWLWHRTTSAQPADAPGSAAEVKSVLHLDGFVVNLSDATGNGYLRVGIALGLGVELK
ncbi:MAG: hypothetical protein WCD57_20045, partial [Acidobacteriaceae bacterium]